MDDKGANYWSKEQNDAFDICILKTGNHSDQEREIIFNTILLPAFKKQACVVMSKTNWHYLQMERRDLIDTLISHAYLIVTKYYNPKAKHASKSFFVYLAMRQYVFGLADKIKRRNRRYLAEYDLDKNIESEEWHFTDQLSFNVWQDREEKKLDEERFNDLLMEFDCFYKYIVGSVWGRDLEILNHFKNVIDGKKPIIYKLESCNKESESISMNRTLENLYIWESQKKIANWYKHYKEKTPIRIRHKVPRNAVALQTI